MLRLFWLWRRSGWARRFRLRGLRGVVEGRLLRRRASQGGGLGLGLQMEGRSLGLCLGVRRLLSGSMCLDVGCMLVCLCGNRGSWYYIRDRASMILIVLLIHHDVHTHRIPSRGLDSISSQ